MHNACKRNGLQVLQKLTKEFYIKEVRWSTHEAALRLIRQQVFIVEQHVPAEIEWDVFDAEAIHLLAFDNMEKVLGCARILDRATIGRMAVVNYNRGRGLGTALLDSAIQICKKSGCKEIKLSSQTHAIGFYEKAGFVVCSDVYLDANIWHVDMQLNI